MSLNTFQSQQLQTNLPQKKIFESSYAQPIQSSSPVQKSSPTRIPYKPQYIQYQISCHYHPQQFITNFCSNPECLLPLCPICVDVHTKEHTKVKGTVPIVEHIDQVIGRNLNDVKKLQREEILAREELNSIEVQRRGIGEEMLTVSNVKRQQCHELIEQYFETLNLNIKASFEGSTSDQRKEIDQIKYELSEVNKKAVREEKNLSNPDKALGTLIQANQNNKLLQMHDVLTEQRIKLHSFKQKLPLLSVNDAEFSNLSLILNQLIKISNQGQQQLNQPFRQPQQISRMHPNSSSFVNQNFNIIVIQQNQKQQLPLTYQSSVLPLNNQQAISSQNIWQPSFYQYPQARTSFQSPYY